MSYMTNHSIDDSYDYSPKPATIKLVDSDSVIDEFVSKYCRHLEGTEAVERLKLEIKGIQSIM